MVLFSRSRSKLPSFVCMLGVGGWNGKMHALMHFQRSEAYEKRDIGLPRKLNTCMCIFAKEVKRS